MEHDSRLARRLSTADAVVIGLGAMIGAGIFAAVGPAAEAAGAGLLLGLVLAAAVAYANATSSAQLAAVHPASGGTYVYGKKQLGQLWGDLAGYAFVVGKVASCAAMALTFATYAAPALTRPLAVGAVVVMAGVNYLGVRKTAQATKVIVGVVLAALAVVVAAVLGGGQLDVQRLAVTGTDPLGVLQAAALLFFAFAGYARIATLGEEVAEPERAIPRAIPMALGITLAVYALVLTTGLLGAGAESLAQADAPLAAAVEAGRLAALSPVVRVGAAVASLGVLLSLLAGVSRTAFAMAADGRLPRALAAVHPRHRTPHRAEVAVAALVVVLAATADLRDAIALSAATILGYYAITNAAALRLPAEQRRWPRWLAAAGLAGCALLAAGAVIVLVTR
jgi:basic amino acid/polyamine antiporter, APA family